MTASPPGPRKRQPRSVHIASGVRRLTLALPYLPGHVHCYLLADSDGWIAVDTGCGNASGRTAWTDELTERGPLRTVFLTHFHHDHAGGARYLSELTAAPVTRSAIDFREAHNQWLKFAPANEVRRWLGRHGVPKETSDCARQFMRRHIVSEPPGNPVHVGADDHIGDWEALPAPGHTDGQLLLLRDGMLLSADHLLNRPDIPMWPNRNGDPVGAWLASLREISRRDIQIALPSHGAPVARPAAFARQLADEEEARLRMLADRLRPQPQTAYDLIEAGRRSDAGLPCETNHVKRVLALAHALARLERLVMLGVAVRYDDEELVMYGRAWAHRLSNMSETRRRKSRPSSNRRAERPC